MTQSTKATMRECPCGKKFRATRELRRYCSLECREKYAKSRNMVVYEVRECEWCGKKFSVLRVRQKQKFCSMDCYRDSIENPDRLDDKSERKKYEKKLKTVVCSRCGQTFRTSKGKKVCSLCRELD